MNFITGKHLPRRTFLRGVGATVALPMLDAMIPAGRSWRDAAAEPGSTRLICMEEVMGCAGSSPLGLEQGFFVPRTLGRNFEMAPESQLMPLEDFREYLTVVSNTDCRMADAWTPEELGGGHSRDASVVFTQAHPKRTQGSDIFVGRSLDQLHAQRYGQEMPLPSLQLDIEPARGGGGNGYHAAYANRISWASPTEPLRQSAALASPSSGSSGGATRPKTDPIAGKHGRAYSTGSRGRWPGCELDSERSIARRWKNIWRTFVRSSGGSSSWRHAALAARNVRSPMRR